MSPRFQLGHADAPVRLGVRGAGVLRGVVLTRPVRVNRERHRNALGECSQREMGHNCRVSDEWVDLCIFDEGFLLGFEEGLQQNNPTPAVGTTLILIPGTVQAN